MVFSNGCAYLISFVLAGGRYTLCVLLLAALGWQEFFNTLTRTIFGVFYIHAWVVWGASVLMMAVCVSALTKDLAYEEFPSLLHYLQFSFLLFCTLPHILSCSSLPRLDLHHHQHCCTAPVSSYFHHFIHSPQKSLICLFLCVSSSHIPFSFITSLADVDLLSVGDSERIFFPRGILDFRLSMPQSWCVSVWHLLVGLGHCSLTLALNGSQFGSRKIFPPGAEWREHVLSQVCRFSSCLQSAWNFCLMAKWFMLRRHSYRYSLQG